MANGAVEWLTGPATQGLVQHDRLRGPGQVQDQLAAAAREP